MRGLRRSGIFQSSVKGSIDEVGWLRNVRFERRLATGFGRRCSWLAGTAPHRAGPIGVQNGNGAESLRVYDTLRVYDIRYRSEWKRLQGRRRCRLALPEMRSRYGRTAIRLLACLPALALNLSALGSQLRLRF
jgi:hypothetical protein